jgi:DNA-binding FrmR family transcriptional regulator
MQADPKEISLLLKTARGQMDGILRMVEENQYCIDISNQLLACQAILKKANQAIIKAHLQGCIKQAFDSSSAENADEKIKELVDLMQKLSR